MNYLDMQSIKAKILTDHYHKNHKNQNQYNVIFILNLEMVSDPQLSLHNDVT